jgi:hypothetical protein
MSSQNTHPVEILPNAMAWIAGIESTARRTALYAAARGKSRFEAPLRIPNMPCAPKIMLDSGVMAGFIEAIKWKSKKNGEKRQLLATDDLELETKKETNIECHL